MAPAKDLKHLLSDEAANRQESPLKSLFKYVHNPDIISLGGGLPLPDYFPWEKIQAVSPAPPFADGIAAKSHETGVAVTTELLKHQVEEYDIPLERALQYGFTAGQPEIVNFLKKHTEIIHKPGYDDWGLILSVGNTQSWAAMIRTFCNIGDSIFIEGYTFSSAIETARALGVNFVPLEMDEYGIIPEAMAAQLENWDPSKPMPKLLYTICTGQNPTGSSLSVERRKAIYDLACKYDFIIIEDEPYYFLQMDEYKSDSKAEEAETPSHEVFVNSLVKAFIHLDTEGRVIRLDSFSKVLAPGTRTGWIVAQEKLLERIIRLNETSIQAPSGFSQALVQGLLGRWGQDGYIDWLIALRKEYTIKRDFTIKALEKHIPSEIVSYVPPIAGMFFTFSIDAAKHPEFKTKFNSDVEAVEMAVFERGLKDGALLVPGSWFKSPNYVSKGTSFFFRGTYASATMENIDLALEKFGKAIKEEFQL